MLNTEWQEMRCAYETPSGFRAPTTIFPIRLRLLGKMVAHLAQGYARDPTEQERAMARTKQNEVATRRIFIRITDAEKANIRDQAKIAGLTMSEYMRRTSLHKRIVSKMDQKALGELARLGGLQKYLLKQIKGPPDEEGLRKGLNSTLSAVLSAVRTLNTVEVK